MQNNMYKNNWGSNKNRPGARIHCMTTEKNSNTNRKGNTKRGLLFGKHVLSSPLSKSNTWLSSAINAKWFGYSHWKWSFLSSSACLCNKLCKLIFCVGTPGPAKLSVVKSVVKANLYLMLYVALLPIKMNLILSVKLSCCNH